MKKKLIAGIATITLLSTGTATAFAGNDEAGTVLAYAGNYESTIERVKDLVDEGIISEADGNEVITVIEANSENCTGEGSGEYGVLREYLEGTGIGAQNRTGNAVGEGSGNQHGGSNGSQSKLQDGTCLNAE